MPIAPSDCIDAQNSAQDGQTVRSKRVSGLMISPAAAVGASLIATMGHRMIASWSGGIHWRDKP